MGYKYLKRGIRIGFSFTLGMMLLLSGCSGGMEEMQTSQIPEDMGSATGEEDVNLVELDSNWRKASLLFVMMGITVLTDLSLRAALLLTER